MSFVHLHVHSHYSILDGMSKVTDLVDKCQRCGMPAMALTDHGNMFGIKEFLDYTKKVNGKLKKAVGEKKDEIGKIEKGDPNDPEVAKLKGTLPQLKEELAALEQKAADYKPFKPIVGIEAYCAHQSRFKEKDTSRGWHLILLAKNKQGYLNLCKLSSLAFIEGFHRHARIDHELLEKYHEGIICSSACLGGEVPQKIMAGDDAGARESILWFKQLFGDDYYLELQRHIMDGVNYDSLVDNQVESGNEEDRTPESVYKRQRQVNAKLLEYAAEYGIKVIATNDAHFVDQEHAEAHDRLICISTNADFISPTR
ncbi:MAG: PHP domain-containing protein, partial [Paludibacteraceae bacterium]|nr:PHP domain-containing protein [Paludibacteraceae bacterium]